MTRGGVTYYYHINGHGDVVTLTEGGGNVVAEYDYDAYGNIISQSGTMASVNPYRYAGYRYDEVTELYYLMARYYDAEVGRFISRDSFHGFEDEPFSLNQYAYCGNNPINYIDPSGHFRIRRSIAAIALDLIILGIATAAKASWLLATQPIKTMGKAAVEAWLKTTFKSRALSFMNVISRATREYMGVKFALKLITTAAINGFVSKLANNIDMLLSIGAFTAGMADWYSDNKLDGWIRR